MAEKISIHRALSELKILDRRIDDSISDSDYIRSVKKDDKKHDGMTLDELEKQIVGDYDKTISLIQRRNKIKQEVVKSNAREVVTVAGQKMTVAEAIERKVSINYEKLLLKNMEMKYSREIAAVSHHNVSLESRLDKYIESITGSSKEDLTSEEIDRHTQTFMERNAKGLVDPLNIKKKISELKEEISNFESEVDSVLSESNALSKIEI